MCGVNNIHESIVLHHVESLEPAFSALPIELNDSQPVIPAIHLSVLPSCNHLRVGRHTDYMGMSGMQLEPKSSDAVEAASKEDAQTQ